MFSYRQIHVLDKELHQAPLQHSLSILDCRTAAFRDPCMAGKALTIGNTNRITVMASITICPPTCCTSTTIPKRVPSFTFTWGATVPTQRYELWLLLLIPPSAKIPSILVSVGDAVSCQHSKKEKEKCGNFIHIVCFALICFALCYSSVGRYIVVECV